jgi:hypothetical protein
VHRTLPILSHFFRTSEEEEEAFKMSNGFLVRVIVKYVNPVKGSGVFAEDFIAEGTLLWVPTLVKKYSRQEVLMYLSGITDREEAAIWLRQAFVLDNEPEYLCVNVDDDGRFVNHSSDPNTGFASTDRPSVALRDIAAGEELTCDYSGLGSPQWYRDLCSSYGALSTDEVVRKFS